MCFRDPYGTCGQCGAQIHEDRVGEHFDRFHYPAAVAQPRATESHPSPTNRASDPNGDYAQETGR